MQHELINTNHNTEDLIMAFFDFMVFNGLEEIGDISADELIMHIRQDMRKGEDNDMTIWLMRFMGLWAAACDKEFSIGHAIEPFHGWKPRQNENGE